MADWVRLGDALMEDSRESLDPGQYARAEQAYQQALALDPKCLHALLGLAWVHNTEHDFDAGGPHPENTAWCRAQLALMSLQTGALLSADAEIKLALRDSPRNPHVLAAAGRIQAARMDYEAAIESCQKSIAAAPTHDALATLVDLYELTGRHDEAKAQFQRVVEFHSTDGGHGHAHAHPHEAPDGHQDETPPGHHHPHTSRLGRLP